MNELYISKQKIIDNKKGVYAYEIVFKDSANKPLGFSNSLKATSKLIINSIGSSELNTLIGRDVMAFINIDTAEVVEIQATKEPAQIVVMQLIKIIKDNNETEELESFIKRQPDLSFKLIEFFNNLKKLDIKVESLIQVITLMGRDKLLRWLIVYLYSEVSQNSASKTILDLAIRRAESMEADADPKHKDKAYLAGMFSMLSSIFDTDIRELMAYVQMDRDITQLVLEKKGIFAASLMRAEVAEKIYLKKIMMANFDQLNTVDLIYTLEDGGIDVNKDDI